MPRPWTQSTSSTGCVNHPIGVAHILWAEGGVRDAEVLAAALLHDTVEDTATTPAALRAEFGDAVADLVAEVTDDKTLPKVQRKRLQVEHAATMSHGARLVKLADKLYNLRDLASRPPGKWDADRVRGYFCWAFQVVEAMGPVNPGLQHALAAVFAGPVLPVGIPAPVVPPEADARVAVLEAYYRQLQ